MRGKRKEGQRHGVEVCRGAGKMSRTGTSQSWERRVEKGVGGQIDQMHAGKGDRGGTH